MTVDELVRGRDTYTLIDLLKRVAEHKGLAWREGASHARSEPIKEYALDKGLLRVLCEQNIVEQARPDCGGDVFTLVDANPQQRIPGFTPSNYWNFKRLDENGGGFDLRISLTVGFGMSTRMRGVTLVPFANGTFVSPSDTLPNFRMFKALTSADDQAPDVARQIANSDGTVVVGWTELGLGGIRSLSALFDEFSPENSNIRQLALNQKVFDPNPYPRNIQPGEALFVVEPAQQRLFRMWSTQLARYRESLQT